MTAVQMQTGQAGDLTGDGGMAADGERRNRAEYITCPGARQEDLDSLRTMIEEARAAGNRSAFLEARRRFLLAQAAAYVATREAAQ